MAALAIYWCSFLLLLGWTPFSIDQALAGAVERGHLPVGFATAVSPRLSVTVQHDRRGAAAYFLPAAPPGVGATAGARQPPYPLPVSQLVLYGPFYLRQEHLLDVLDMPVDLTDSLFHALLLAHLHLQVIPAGGPLTGRLRSRAETLLAELPEAVQMDGYLDALASFGSHLLAMANELERLQRRREAGGRSLCAALQRSAPLFTLWRSSFESGLYPARVWLPAAPPERPVGRTMYSRAALAPVDKRLVVREILHASWTGDPRHDFGPRFCR